MTCSESALLKNEEAEKEDYEMRGHTLSALQVICPHISANVLSLPPLTIHILLPRNAASKLAPKNVSSILGGFRWSTSALFCFNKFFWLSFLSHFTFWLHWAACTILIPQPKIELCPLKWKHSLNLCSVRGVPPHPSVFFAPEFFPFLKKWGYSWLTMLC